MVIVDASVAFKWFDASESFYKRAKLILQKHANNENDIYVPDLFFYEITNAWSTKSRLDAADIKNNLTGLKTLKLVTVPVQFNLLEKAATLSRKYHVSVYDAIYAVLAREKQCLLVTADAIFVKQVKLQYVKLLSDYV